MTPMLDLLTPVRLADGRTGVTVGRTVPTTASEARYDVRIGTAIEADVRAADVTAIGAADSAALQRAREASARAFGAERGRIAA